MKKYLMGIDIGTSGLKAIVIDKCGAVIAAATEPYHVYYPQPYHAQQNVLEWWDALKVALKKLFCSVSPLDIEAVGIDGQSWSMIPIDKNGNVLMENPIWQDNRSHEIMSDILLSHGEKKLFEVSKNPFNSAYTTGKILWMKKYRPEAYKNTYKILQSNSYIAYKLTGVASQDISQGYGLHNFDVEKKKYDESISDLLGIDIEKLPQIYACDAIIGMVTKAVETETGLKAGTRVVAGGLDAACGTLGVGVIHNGETQEQGGQAGGMSICLSQCIADKRLILSPHVIDGYWLLQGGTVGGGGTLKWFEREFGFEEREMAKIQGSSSFAQLSTLASSVPSGSDGMIFLPYMQGERSPIWNADAKGIYYGISYSSTKAHFVRSTMEGVAYSLQHNIAVAKKAGADISRLYATGGAANSLVWTQIKSDVTGKEIVVPNSDIATALGACLLAGVGTGYYKNYDEAVKFTVKVQRVHIPNMVNNEVYKKQYEKYLMLYDSTKCLID